MKRKFDLYLADIIEAIDRLEEYTCDVDFDAFTKKKMVVDAVLRNLEIIGEAASQVPEEVKQKHGDIPWRDIQDFRIVVAHHYWRMNLERVWDIVQHKLSSLREQVQGVLNNEKK